MVKQFLTADVRVQLIPANTLGIASRILLPK